jgi:hypothetical protein
MTAATAIANQILKALLALRFNLIPSKADAMIAFVEQCRR